MTALTDDLARIVGTDAVSDRESVRRSYAHDLWPKYLIESRANEMKLRGPTSVVWPQTDEQVSSLFRYAKAQGIRVAPFGGGSGVCGMTAVDGDAILLDTKRMRTVHSVDVDRGRAVIDSGILGQTLEDTLLAQGATLGHYPSSISCSTLGGWIVTRGAGQCSGRYGKIEDMVLGLEGVRADGEPFSLGRPAPGEVDARAMMVGSEGLYGLVTRAHMRVWPAPTGRKFAAFSFATLAQAWDAVRSIYQSGLRPAVARIYDPFDSYVFRTGKRRTASHAEQLPTAHRPLTEWLMRRAAKLLPLANRGNFAFGERFFGRSMLILVFEHTHNEPVESGVERARRACLACGGQDEGEAPGRRWLERRHSVSYRMPATYAKGLWVDTMEVAAPWGNFQTLYESVRAALGEGGFVMAHMSHAYPDGCSIYFTFAGASTTDTKALQTYEHTWNQALIAAHTAGGTIAHHHGIGRSKRSMMRLEHGAGLDVIAQLARRADPHGIFAGGPLIAKDGEGPPSRGGVEQRSELSVDRVSRLLSVRVNTPMPHVIEALAQHGLALRSADSHRDVLSYVRAICAADVLADPVDHRVAGYVARLHSGRLSYLQAAPRRSAGPELWSLFAQSDHRWGTLESITLRVHHRDEQEVLYTAPFDDTPVRTTDNIRQWIQPETVITL